MCQEQGLITPATVCDHIEPHRGDVAAFWRGPFQSLCKTHHDGAKQQYEVTGKMRGCDTDGYPLGRSDW